MKNLRCCALVILVAVVGLVSPAAAGDKAAPQEARQTSPKTDTPELQGLLQLLENPEAARKTAESLRALLPPETEEQEAPSAQPAQEEAKSTEQGLPVPLHELFSSYEAYRGKAASVWARLEKEARGLLTRARNLRAYLSREENRRILIAFWVQLGVALLAGLGAWWGLRRLTRRWEKNLTWATPSGPGKRIGRALLTASFRLYPWAGLSLFVLLFFLLFPHLSAFRAVLLQGILALALYGLLGSLLQSALAPAAESARRLLPLDDETAGYAYVWARRALLFTLSMSLMIIPGAAYGLTALTSVFDAALKTGLIVMLAFVLAQRQQAIQRAIGLRVRKEDSPWRARAKRAAGFLLGKFYIAAVVYMGLVVALSLLGARGVYRYLIRAAAETLLIVVVAALCWSLWGLLFRKLFEVSRGLRERYPDLEAEANRYVHFLEDGGDLLILLMAIFAMLEAWGLDVYALLSSSVAVKILLQIPLTILGAVLLIKVGGLLLTGLEKEVADRMRQARRTSPGEAEKRVSTLGRICRSVLYLVTITTASMLVLDSLGLDIKPILAGAGIVGLAVGFGAQNLVKDVISGLFFIIENRIRVGDVAILNGTGGLVEQVNLRTTVLRALDGTIHVFPNGSITSLSNMTHEFSYYLFNVGVAYKEDTDRVTAVLQEVGKEMLEDEEYKDLILEPLEVLGVDQFADSAVIIKARIKTVPIKQWAVGREMNRRIKKRFDEEGIEIPFPHRTFYFGEASRSVAVALQAEKDGRDTLKDLVREVLEETREAD